MLLLFGAFIAGLLTVVAPCVLPLLPIIIGGSVTGDATDKKRPYVIIAALATSLIIFTLLLKASTLLINIPPKAITYFSGSIIITLGLLTLFPIFYAKVMAKVGFEKRSQQLLGKGFKNKSSLAGPIIIGAALGPVFSSCSPVYAYILATVLPANFFQAFAYIIAYVLGLSAILLLISIYGQRFISRIKFAANPKGWFQRGIAILFIAVGLLVFTGYDKRVQTWVSTHTPLDFDSLSAKLIPGSSNSTSRNGNLNVEPYDAPELVGIQDWINSKPLTLKDLRGKVVLVDFWTYSCINCIRNNPYIEKWYKTYKDQGFVVIGMHAPEFAFEKVLGNVKKGVNDQKITYPVALDNDFSTWNAFRNQYWPAAYLIDAEGKVRREHFGEGEYQESEDAIRALLEEKGARLSGKMVTTGKEKVPQTSGQTPETYLGSARASNYSGSPALGASNRANFTQSSGLRPDYWSLGGTWEVDEQSITARGNSTLRFRVSGKEVYLVMGAETEVKVGLQLDGKPVSQTRSAGSDVTDNHVIVKESKLYRLVSHPTFVEDSIIELTIPDGVTLNAFTFGS